MREKYIQIENLSISEKLIKFVKNELLPGTDIKSKNFWIGFSKSVHELSPINKKLLEIRINLQKKIDEWHKEKKKSKNQ